MSIAVPEAAIIRRNLITQNNLSVITSKLKLEINEVNLFLLEEILENRIDFKSQLLDLCNLLRSCKPDSLNMMSPFQKIAMGSDPIEELEKPSTK